MAKKRKKPTPEYDSQRETRVLLEEIRDEVKIVAEQHGTIKEDLSEVKAELKTAKMALMDNSMQIKSLKSGQERIEKKLDNALDNHGKRIKNLEAKVGL